MKVIKAEYTGRQQALLTITFEGDRPKGLVGTDTHLGIERGHGVYLGSEWEELLEPIKVPKTGGKRAVGCTKDKHVVELATQLFEDVRDGKYEPGTVIFEADDEG